MSVTWDETNPNPSPTISLKSVKVDWLPKEMLPHPGNFINFFVEHHKGPAVIMPDGRVLSHSNNPDSLGEFTDKIAEIYARENNGIYIPSNFGTEDRWIKYGYFLEGICRSIHNNKSSNLKVDWTNLVQEEKYLDKVRIKSNQNERGIEGRIKSDNKNSCSLYLGFDRRFGNDHLNAARKVLSSKLDVKKMFYKESDEWRSIKEFIGSNTDFKEKRFSFGVECETYDPGEICNINLTMYSPFIFSDIDGHPTLPTQEMLPIFNKVIEHIDNGLKKLANYYEVQRKERYEEIKSIMELK